MVDVIIGGQDPPGTGSYLVSDEGFDNFELVIEARPALKLQKFDPKAMLERSGRPGHIALEVHDNDVRGQRSFVTQSRVPWRNVYVRTR